MKLQATNFSSKQMAELMAENIQLRSKIKQLEQMAFIEERKEQTIKAEKPRELSRSEIAFIQAKLIDGMIEALNIRKQDIGIANQMLLYANNQLLRS